LHPYVAATPPGASVAAGYMVIINLTDADDRFIGATSDIADKVEVHRSLIENNVAKMRRIDDGLVLPAGSTVVLKPGDSHIMFIGLTKQLVRGERHSATLYFEEAGKFEIEFDIEDIGDHTDVDHANTDH